MVMRLSTALLAMLAATLACEAQTIHSVGVYSMGRTHERDWTVGSGAMRFGFEQYSQYRDASGRDLHVFSDVMAKGVSSPRYTILHCGPGRFRIRGPAWCAATMVGIVVVSLLFVTI